MAKVDCICWKIKAKINNYLVSLTLIIDSKGLAPISEDLVLADIAVPRRAVPVGGLYAHDLVVDAALVHRLHVGRLSEYWFELVDVCHGDVDWYAGKGIYIIIKKYKLATLRFVRNLAYVHLHPSTYLQLKFPSIRHSVLP